MPTAVDTKPRAYTMLELQRCAMREWTIRRNRYPNKVMTGRMSQELADSEIDKMAAIVAHFAELAEKERLL